MDADVDLDPQALGHRLRRWATEEMGLPPNRLPTDGAFRRLCVGQGASIWAYVTEHIHSPRNVKKIRGNVLWYAHLDRSQAGGGPPHGAQRRLELQQAVARVRAELSDLDLSLELAEREAEAQEEAVEDTLGRIQDAQRRALLFQARAAGAAWQRRSLRDRVQRLEGQLVRLRDIRKASVDVMLEFPPASLPSAPADLPALEPDVLRDVRRACALRADLLDSLLDCGPERDSWAARQSQSATTHRQWLSSVEVLLGSHPPAHVLGALEFLAQEQMAQLQRLTNMDDPGTGQKLSLRSASPPPQVTSDISTSPHEALPSLQNLIQDGWRGAAELLSRRSPLLQEHRTLTLQLHRLLQNVEQLGPGDPAHRLALVLGVRAARLRGLRAALGAQCQALEAAGGRRQRELRDLQAKQKKILSFRSLVEERQQQIRALIKGNSRSKSQLLGCPGEVRQEAQQKVVAVAVAVESEGQALQGALERDAQLLEGLNLHPLLHPLPPLDRTVTILPQQQRPPPEERSHPVVTSLGLPPHQAPELLLAQVADLRQDCRFLQAQLQQRSAGVLGPLRMHSTSTPLVQELLATQASQEQEQAARLCPALQQLQGLLAQGLQRGPRLWEAIEDWWEQPAQRCVAGLRRGGLTLAEWQQRWSRARTGLQGHSG
ncbi:HAUS augmin-like complex subunit 5 [Tachyglossus aculeatus]|uniref:HAUS augmin-like complex subunit 5 n=1 Tax=Tachyglossus aculeatus TaxID=9261 RepID=UPI0018F3DD3E|nr:HAUS augmin-like complex subunit 5 [Tachyglossus aculeatus]